MAADGDRLAITGPTLTDAQRAWVAKHKTEILQEIDAEDAKAERVAIIHEGHTIGVDHERLIYNFQGHRFRLTDVHGEIIKPILY